MSVAKRQRSILIFWKQKVASWEVHRRTGQLKLWSTLPGKDWDGKDLCYGWGTKNCEAGAEMANWVFLLRVGVTRYRTGYEWCLKDLNKLHLSWEKAALLYSVIRWFYTILIISVVVALLIMSWVLLDLRRDFWSCKLISRYRTIVVKILQSYEDQHRHTFRCTFVTTVVRLIYTQLPTHIQLVK